MLSTPGSDCSVVTECQLGHSHFLTYKEIKYHLPLKTIELMKTKHPVEFLTLNKSSINDHSCLSVF